MGPVWTVWTREGKSTEGCRTWHETCIAGRLNLLFRSLELTLNSGIYTAYSGLRAQSDALDIVSNNLANLNTTGFKEETAFFTLLNQAVGANDLTSVVNRSIRAEALLNTVDGAIAPTNRDLDIALVGNGFMAVGTPGGVRYTRNGSLNLNSKFVLSTADGFPVLGLSGRPITLGPGRIQINEDGEVFVNDAPVDRLKIVSVRAPSMLIKEGNSLFVPREDQAVQTASDVTVMSGYLEQSNVNAVSSVVRLVGIMRQFEAIQKSISLIMNDVNTKSIEKLGR